MGDRATGGRAGSTGSEGSARSENLTFVSLVFQSNFVESGYVGEHGGTQASSNDQPVCFDGRLRRGSGEAASTSGPLAV